MFARKKLKNSVKPIFDFSSIIRRTS